MAAAALLAAACHDAAAQGADPMRRKFGETSVRESSIGRIVDAMNRDQDITGTIGKGGKLATKFVEARDRWEGTWMVPASEKGEKDEECGTARDGSKYWGKIWFKLSEFGRVFTGKVGSCDEEPDEDFSAKWPGK